MLGFGIRGTLLHHEGPTCLGEGKGLGVVPLPCLSRIQVAQFHYAGRSVGIVPASRIPAPTAVFLLGRVDIVSNPPRVLRELGVAPADHKGRITTVDLLDEQRIVDLAPAVGVRHPSPIG